MTKVPSFGNDSYVIKDSTLFLFEHCMIQALSTRKQLGKCNSINI